MHASHDTNDIAVARRLAARPFTLFVLGSVSVHAMVLFALPGAISRIPVDPAPLQVTLEQRLPPRPLPVARRESPPEKPRKPPQEKKAPLPVEQRPQPTEAPQVLAVPRQASVSEPVFAAPAPEPPAAPPRELASAAPKAESPPADKITAPVFNAAYLRNPEPVYPVSARRRGEQGTVMLKVLVTREGTAASVSVDKSSGSAALDRAAVEAVRKWRFAPARRGTDAVESSVLVPIVFRLEGVS